MPPRRLTAVLLASLAACSGGGATRSAGPVPIDPNRPGDPLYADGLALFDAANQAAAASRALAATDPSGAAAQQATALADYTAAQGDFDALAVQFPDSIRRPDAAYLAGRCSYERGTLTSDPAEFADARDRLDAMLAAFPSAPPVPDAEYFDGRSRFRLSDWLGARAEFVASLAAAPAGLWADNAQYFLGRCDFEEGYALAHATTPDPAGASARFQLAEPELAAVTAASTWYDNARYYLGRSWFEEPVDTTMTGGSATRASNLEKAEAAFGQVLAIAGTTYAPEAHHWRGRAEYAHAFYYAGTGLDPADLAAALADFKAVPATSSYQDNALHYAAKTYVNMTPSYCTTLRPGDATPASACAALATLTSAWPASPYVVNGTTVSYLQSNGCTCP